MPTTKQQRRRALELLEASIDGCTEAILLAYGFKTELLVELVNAGLATATIDRRSSAGAGSKSSACGLLRLAGGRWRSFDGPDPHARISFSPIRRMERRRLRCTRRRCRGRPHPKARRGCGRWPLGIMRIARRRKATKRRARPRWRRLRKAGGGNDRPRG